jgi:O-antigen ligase
LAAVVWVILAGGTAVLIGMASLSLDALELSIAGAGVIGLGVVFVWPNAGLIILVGISYIRVSDVLVAERGAPSIADPLIALLTLLVIGRWITSRRVPNAGLRRAAILLAVYGLVGLSTLLHAADPGRAQAAFVIYGKNAVFVLLVMALLRSREGFRGAIWALLVGGSTVATFGVLQVVTGNYDQTFFGFAQTEVRHIAGAVSSHRLGGSIGDPNYFSQLLVLLVPLAFDRFRRERSSGLRVFAGASLALYLLAITFTYSRGGFLALAVVGILVVVQLKPRPRSLVLAGMATVLAVALLPSSAKDRLGALPSAIESTVDDDVFVTDQALTGRTSELLVAWEMFSDHQLTGVGLDNYEVHYQEYSGPLGLDPRPGERSAHNLYLEVAAETGLPGLLAFGAILYVALWSLLWAGRTFDERGWDDSAALARALWTGLVGYLVAALFIHDAYPRSLWLLIAIALAVPAIAAATPVRRRPGDIGAGTSRVVVEAHHHFEMLLTRLRELQAEVPGIGEHRNAGAPAREVGDTGAAASLLPVEVHRHFEMLLNRLRELEAEVPQIGQQGHLGAPAREVDASETSLT